MKQSFTPTAEQTAIVDFAVNEKQNLIVNAYAGAAKTSTLVLITEALKSTPILMLAFNKKTAIEMQEKVHSLVVCKTLNALGHRAWMDQIKKRVRIKSSKIYYLLKDYIEQTPKWEKEKLYAEMPSIIKAIRYGKTCGFIPEALIATTGYNTAKPLMNSSEFEQQLDTKYTDLEWLAIIAVSTQSIIEAFEGILDFDDQILMPTCFPANFPNYPLVMVDETQDLSTINHAMLAKVAKKRLIAVGDRCQSIYGFRGAHADSMDWMRDRFSMHTLSLNASFRCPLEVIKTVLNHAPNMVGWEKSIIGSVKFLPEWNIDDLDENSVIICRNNAPLFSMAINILKDGKAPELKNNDISANMKKILKSFGEMSIIAEEVHRCITGWRDKELKKARKSGKARILDQADCLHIFADEGATLGEAIAYLENITAAKGNIKLLTGHGSKGLEFERVFYLDQHLLDFQSPQEKNLNYVIKTRAQKELFFVKSVEYIRKGQPSMGRE